jgi:selenide,water dikinase
VIIGGHSVDITNILYGLAVTGTIHPKDIKGNDGAKKGDVVILTKGLGTGVLNNMVKFSELSSEIYNGLISSMTRLNKNASECMVRANANACTDVTGFGFAGHAMQLAKASGINLIIDANKLPVLEGAINAVENSFLTRGDKSNREYTKNFYTAKGTINKTIEHLIFDPQTSGGLLISVPEKNAAELLTDLKNNDDEKASVIGYVAEAKKYPAGTFILEY